jgi:16S rRNA processing protein RimM
LTETPARPPASSGAGLSVGRVGRPHGLDGSFYVTRPLGRLLTLGTTVRVAGPAAGAERSAAIVRRAGTEQHPIVRLEGVGDRAAAEALRGAQLSVHGADVPPLGEGEWWAHELEGCSVVDGERRLGTVVRMVELPSCEALEVDRGDGSPPLLVPMVKDAIRAIDVAGARIEVDLGFLDPASPSAPSAGVGDDES